MIKDRFGRMIEVLRISVTQECNLACPYCHREGEGESGVRMSADEIRRIVDACARLGVRKVKITGGEPLMREDIVDVVMRISSACGIEEVSMTTNGMMLKDKAVRLRKAGLSRINIGCDSFSSSVLEKSAGRMRPSIMAAKEAGFDSIKLNMVVMRGLNDSDMADMIGFAKETGTILQLIELVRTKDNNEFFSKYFFSLAIVEDELARMASAVETREMHNRKRYHVDGAVVEVVRPHNEEFCGKCRTIRVSSGGKIKPCLLRDDNLVDVDFSKSDDELQKLILVAVNRREPFVRGTAEVIV